MASIWIEATGKPAKKIKGHLPMSPATTALFKAEVERIARANLAKVTMQTPTEALMNLPKPKGGRVYMFLEPASPPSAPEPNEAKHVKGGCGIFIRVPKGGKAKQYHIGGASA